MSEVRAALDRGMLDAARAAMAAGNYDEALEDIFLVLSISPFHEDARMLLLECALQFLTNPLFTVLFAEEGQPYALTSLVRDAPVILSADRTLIQSIVGRSAYDYEIAMKDGTAGLLLKLARFTRRGAGYTIEDVREVLSDARQVVESFHTWGFSIGQDLAQTYQKRGA